ncbi:MAG: hypothetical protein ACI4CA_09410 [Bacteroides sp.]
MLPLFLKNPKMEAFRQATATRSTLLLTMITPQGVAHNSYWNQVQSEITAKGCSSEPGQRHNSKLK